jgi:hypothetical protein
MMNGELRVTTTTESLTLGEPDAALFEIPADYRKVETRSEYFGKGARSRGKVFPQETLERMDRADVERKKKGL